MILKTIKGMTFKLFSETMRFFGRKSSDGFKIDQSSMNDEFVDAYDNMVNDIPISNASTTPTITTITTTDGPTDWKKSSLASKYNTLIMEMELVLAEEKTTTDKQKYIKLKERELELVTEIYYIETTILRMEISTIRAIKN